MQRHSFITLASLAFVAVLTGGNAWAQQNVQAPVNLNQQDPPQMDPQPTPEQIRALVKRVTDNQHRDDLALEQYERKERIVNRSNGKGDVDSERTMQVVPAGIRIVRVELERDGKSSDPAFLEQQWQGAAQALVRETQVDDPDVAQNDEREAKRLHQRFEMVDAIGSAFRFHWVGRVTEGSRTLLEFSFDPDPTYKSSVFFATAYAHLVGTVWVDESNCQVVRVVARLKDDFSIAGGLIAKIYRGSQAALEQAEVAPGIWEPTNYSLDWAGRKFVFSALSGHERMDASEYRHLGPLEEALATIRREHPGATASSH